MKRWAPLALVALRLGMAIVFIAAAAPKIREPDLFASAIYNYKMLPPWGVNTLALVLPWLELFIGVLLALGIWVRASAAWMASLMVVFMVAFVFATSRGLDIACGCFEVGEGAKPTSPWRVVLRDSAMLAAALVLLRFGGGSRRRLGAGAAPTRRRPNLDAAAAPRAPGV
jgi:uncharacterized membrane protein YphA (DoxX/SURF4 family)